jgi:hypothetical protein
MRREAVDRCHQAMLVVVLHPCTPHQESKWLMVLLRRLQSAEHVTIKDKFPILVVAELLDELKGVGAKFFTQLDLCSGYPQVRMHPANVEKTAFCTHERLLELLVMPFDLTNASTTFQALMNEVLQPFM